MEQNNWPKGYEPPPDFERMGDKKTLIRRELQEQQVDRAEYSKLKDQLAGLDPETDRLMAEIDGLQLDIIAALSKEVMHG
jgi:hypothetical protein